MTVFGGSCSQRLRASPPARKWLGKRARFVRDSSYSYTVLRSIFLGAKIKRVLRTLSSPALEQVYSTTGSAISFGLGFSPPMRSHGILESTTARRAETRTRRRIFRKCNQPRLVLTSSIARRITSASEMPSRSASATTHLRWDVVRTTLRCMPWATETSKNKSVVPVYNNTVGMARGALCP